MEKRMNLEEIKKQAEYCLNCKTKPCMKGCPLQNNISDFIKNIKEEQYEEALKSSKEEKEGVHIITMHACKGLEYQTVFLPDCNEGKVPHKKAVSSEELEEERRMFYVAMTRAKSYLEVLYIEDELKKHLQVSRFAKK